MFSVKDLSFSYTLYLAVTITGAMFALLVYHSDFGNSSSAAYQIFRNGISNTHLGRPAPPTWSYDEQPYRALVFSRDPLVIYIKSFLSEEEIAHLLRLSEDKFEPSRVFRGFDESRVDLDIRNSESTHVDREDEVVRRIEKRAMEFQGWRGNDTVMEEPTVQRYRVDGFYNYHFDWDPSVTKGNRVTTFNVYLVGDCTGGGTNFPFLPQPSDMRWCDVIECDEEGRDGYQGVTFKPIAGSAVYWENIHPNGSTHKGVYHAGLPVKSGVKVGLNIWSWDTSWKSPEAME